MGNTYNLFTKTSQALFYNLKPQPIQSMLDFDFFSQREIPSVAAIIHPGRSGFHKVFWGAEEILIPIYPTIIMAVQSHPSADALINFASFRSAFETTKEGLLQPTIYTVTIIAESMPERQAKELIALAKMQGKVIIGPATVGGIVAGVFRIGHAGGSNENILRARLYRPGSVGLVSRSGGMMNELFNILSRATDGVHEGIAIGGDQFPGSTLLDHLLRYEQNPHIQMMVALGEIGSQAEYEIIAARKAGVLTKPLMMWVSGTCAGIFPWEVQFGHAGAKSGKEEESAAAKNRALRETGIVVPDSFELFEQTLHEMFKKTVTKNAVMVPPQNISSAASAKVPRLPERTPTHFTSTISDDRGDEPTYYGVPVSKLVQENAGIGEIIGLLWFTRKLPRYFAKFLEQCIILVADHGPAVSGAHNAIVAARAGKDVISSLASGLLTIGPRFGGAIDDACRYFKNASDTGKSPAVFVQEMKAQGILIPGIGHRVKSVHNPDQRGELLKEFAHKEFPATPYLNYALEVEKITVQKADSLILNVDGCIAALFLDALAGSQLFNTEEVTEIVEVGYMNGLFALARSIGMIGHILDQKRLKEPLYRHPTEDILYNERKE